MRGDENRQYRGERRIGRRRVKDKRVWRGGEDGNGGKEERRRESGRLAYRLDKKRSDAENRGKGR